jgi:hypothetical protein
MRGATKAEELCGVRIGAMRQIFEAADLRAPQSFNDVARQVELGVTLAGAGRKKALVRGIGGNKPRHEFRADFVVRLTDQGADGGRQVLASRTEAHHRGDGLLDEPLECAPPARMGRSDNARLRVGEQYRAAICRCHAHGKAELPRDHGVGARRVLARPGRVGHHDRCGMDLIRGHQVPWRHFERGGHAGSIFLNPVGCIVRSQPAIETRIKARRYPSVPREEGVPNLWVGRKQRRL